jgi:ribosome-associated toxin RatA of RatAB toxin-antitoxin module
MHAERAVDIHAPPETVYGLASDVTRWPSLLPHYRWVRELSRSAQGRVVEMAAKRDWIPVRWTALVALDPAAPRISFTHLSGWAKGMRVAWLFDRDGAGTRVTIVHDLARPRSFPGVSWFDRRVIGDFFIQPIAGQTLARMKELAEAANG